MVWWICGGGVGSCDGIVGTLGSARAALSSRVYSRTLNTTVIARTQDGDVGGWLIGWLVMVMMAFGGFHCYMGIDYWSPKRMVTSPKTISIMKL